jgi:glycine oxidase
VRWLDNKQLLELEPRLNPALLGGMVYPLAQVIAYRYVLALFKAAEKYGATLMHGKVVGLERQGQKVASVTLASGQKIDTSVVVLSMGPWCHEAEKWLGLHVPVYPVRGQILLLDVPGRQMNAVVMYGGMYIVRKADGTTLAGATQEHDSGFEVKTTEEGKQVLMEASLKMAPSLAEARVINHLAGLRPGSKDHIPIIGPVPGWDDIYLITGHFRSGLLLNTASSKAVADLITTGQTSLSIDAFSPARLARE